LTRRSIVLYSILRRTQYSIGAGTSFSVGRAKFVIKQSTQPNSKYNIYAIGIFEKCICGAQWGAGRKPQKEAGEFLKIVVLKVTLESEKLLLTVSYKKMTKQDVAYYMLPQSFCWGSTLLSRFARLCNMHLHWLSEQQLGFL